MDQSQENQLTPGQGLPAPVCSLRPCPFCGGRARFCGDESEEINVICDDCEATVEAATKASAAKAWNRRAEEMPRRIGDISNYYGGLSVKTEGGKCFWSIENYDGDNWSEIPRDLFDALCRYQDSANVEVTRGADRKGDLKQ